MVEEEFGDEEVGDSMFNEFLISCVSILRGRIRDSIVFLSDSISLT